MHDVKLRNAFHHPNGVYSDIFFEENFSDAAVLFVSSCCGLVIAWIFLFLKNDQRYYIALLICHAWLWRTYAVNLVAKRCA
jgi:hypothetical protein